MQSTPSNSSSVLVVIVALLLATLAPYTGCYVYFRATHRLVNYGSYIAGPHATSGIGFTTAELVFLPLTSIESLVRSGLKI